MVFGEIKINELEAKYLAHHGILGQKWGKRNGPPYPINGSDHSVSEKKAGYKKSLNGGHNENLYNRNNTSSSKEKSEFHLSEQQKKYFKIGATVVGTALVAYGGYKLSTSPTLRRLAGRGIDAISKRPSVDDMIAFGGPEIVSKTTGEVIKDIDAIDLSSYSPKVQEAYNKASQIAKSMNPTKSDINCGPCSILCHVNDRLGSSYKAANVDMSNYDGLSKYFSGYDKSTKAVRVNLGFADDIKESYSDMIDLIKTHGNGSSGICSGKYTGTSEGHFLSWKVVDGMVLFSDGQTGNVYLKDAYDKVFKDMDYRSLAFSRLDDLSIIKNALKDIAL